MQTITVKNALPKAKDGSQQVAIFDRNDNYKWGTPDDNTPEAGQVEGELFIGDDRPITVPLTSAVKTALNEKRLVEVDGEGDEAESEDDDSEAAGAYTLKGLMRLSRDELDALADEEGIEAPADLENKEAVAQAILDKQGEEQS